MESISLLFKVLWSPGEAMSTLSKNPKVLVPMVFLALFALGVGGATIAKVDFGEMYMRMLEKTPQGANMSVDQKAQMQKVMGGPVGKGIFFASAVFGSLVVIIVVAGVYFALFTMLGRDGGFKAFTSITAYAFVPIIFSQLAGLLRAFVVPSSSLMLDELGSLSAAVFLDRDAVSPVVFSAANSLDFINLWILALLVIGYKYVASKAMSTGTRTVAVVAVFLVYVALKLLLTAVRGV
jgi:Yip1 domain